ncbi:MAG: hypothetical protein HOD58_12255 [Gammaproteobacteria bacterium]|jgi:hypothetical protein|nr:hypothetical protein [Gammaproteobacteria bacterium]
MDSDFICIGTECMLKAQPIEEDGRRILYFEASNEGVDIQGERVMAKALSESSDHFIKFGNIDIDHYTIIGHKLGLPEPFSYEVGRPIEAKCSGERTFVKAEIYQGGGPLAKNANMLWESVTALTPPARWYPSVGGKVLSKSVDEDPDTGEPITIVDKVRWTNIGLSRTPVNQHLGTVSTAPVGVFHKSLGALVMVGDMSKALTAGYGTDSSSLSGGAALRTESLHGSVINYYDYREKLSALLNGRDNSIPHDLMPQSLIAYSVHHFGLSSDMATEFVTRFFSDLSKRGKSSNE